MRSLCRAGAARSVFIYGIKAAGDVSLFLSFARARERARPRERFLHFNGAPYADARTSGDGEKARRDRAVSVLDRQSRECLCLNYKL